MKINLTEQELVNLVQRLVEEVNETPTKILDVPHYLQSDDSTCGPASLRMVFAYYGQIYSEKDIAEVCDHTYELGCKSEDMACAAESMGFDVYIKNNSSIEEVERLINVNVPVIVDWFCGDPPEGHSSVVIGYNDNNLFILDPYLEQMRVVSKADFTRCWFDFYETPITPTNLYVGQIIVIRPGKSEIKESDELKERCWKGYTQKGMKTMFGKRYPNCVKKKKGVNEDKDETAKYIKCRNCKKKYTQTIYKKKKSEPICPHCGTHQDIESPTRN